VIRIHVARHAAIDEKAQKCLKISRPCEQRTLADALDLRGDFFLSEGNGLHGLNHYPKR
jgi:hypothetical protein